MIPQRPSRRRILRALPFSAFVLSAAMNEHSADADTGSNSALPAGASVVWQMGAGSLSAARNPLEAKGDAALGIALEGRERSNAIDEGGDGIVARVDGNGYVDAGQGTGDSLRPSGNALTIAMRLRSPSGRWGGPLFSRHGGHDRLVWNLFSFPDAIGFELGVRGKAGMTQVRLPVDRIGAQSWHTIIGRYDGTHLQLFADGVLMDTVSVSGPLRESNLNVPVLISAEMNDRGEIHSGWSGEIEYVALWNRALTDTEIVRLGGGESRVAARKKEYREMHILPAPPDLYREALRPQFHFTARQWTVRQMEPGQREEGWLNDPNGLIWLDGTYHLFAQRWARCWIHAVSTDLVHWTEVQPAFWDDPHEFGGWVQSGGAVYDRKNMSGLGTAKNPPLIAFWAGGDNLHQCLSYSLDKGKTWTKYAGNPILTHPERDPKVFWYAPDKIWIMVLSDGDTYRFFRSRNLLSWSEIPDSVLPNSFECPDLFEMPVFGGKGSSKWVMVRGNGKYSVGTFDGQKFMPETEQLTCDFGPNFYATQSWGDIGGHPGRRVQIAWMRGGKYPGMPFNQQMTFPCDLTLEMGLDRRLSLIRNPILEIASLHGTPRKWKALDVPAGAPMSLDMPGDLLHIITEVDVPAGGTLVFRFHGGAKVTVTESHVAWNDDKPVPVPFAKVWYLVFLVDRTSVETFANAGAVSLSACYLPSASGVTVEATGGTASLRRLVAWPLKSAWEALAEG